MLVFGYIAFASYLYLRTIPENLETNYESRAVFAYLQYSRNISQLMPLRLDESVSQRWGVNITVGSPILQLALFVPEYVWVKEASEEDNSLENSMEDVEGIVINLKKSNQYVNQFSKISVFSKTI